MTIAVAIISNKQQLNPLLLESISFADEIIQIIDSKISTGDSGNKKIKVYHRPLDGDYSAQRNHALVKTKSDWVLFVDDDEYVSRQLRHEIEKAIKEKDLSGYLIKRLDTVFHRPLLFGETGNIKLLRLAKRSAGVFERPVHESWKIKGRVGELKSPLYHNKNNFISDFIPRMNHYSYIDAKILKKEGKPFSWFRLFSYPSAKFILNYIIKGGVLDGYAGLFFAYLMAVQSLTVRVFQWVNKS